MKVLILGSGGREHALAWAVKRSPRVTEIVCAPGNGGMAQIARCVPVDLKDLAAMVRLAEAEQPALTIVGPELPLSLGIVDALQQRGLRVFGPTRAAAMLESSKGFAKLFLQRHNIPTANYAVCTSTAEVEKAVEMFHPPIVVKADGLAAGKGVIICDSRSTASRGRAGPLHRRAARRSSEQQVVIEEFLEGDEISFLCLSDGKHVTPLVPAQDHKRIGEGDTGPNTGGMGVYSTDSLLDPAMSEWILHHIARPTIAGHGRRGYALYRRALLRPHDDRARPAGARIQRPLRRSRNPGHPGPPRKRSRRRARSLRPSALDGRLAETPCAGLPALPPASSPAPAAIPAATKPDCRSPASQLRPRFPGVQVFHAGTALKWDGQVVTAGGRVLGVTAAADSLDQALARAYQAMAEIHFEGMYYRRDIGHRALNRDRNWSPD